MKKTKKQTKRRTNKEIQEAQNRKEEEKKTEERRIAALIRKLNRKKKNEERFTGRRIEYYLELKEIRGIKNSTKRTNLIKHLMEVDKLNVGKTSHLWRFQQWDSLEDKYLKWAWDMWGERAYRSIT